MHCLDLKSQGYEFQRKTLCSSVGIPHLGNAQEMAITVTSKPTVEEMSSRLSEQTLTQSTKDGDS